MSCLQLERRGKAKVEKMFGVLEMKKRKARIKSAKNQAKVKAKRKERKVQLKMMNSQRKGRSICSKIYQKNLSKLQKMSLLQQFPSKIKIVYQQAL